jgi:hypothetical protein
VTRSLLFYCYLSFYPTKKAHRPFKLKGLWDIPVWNTVVYIQYGVRTTKYLFRLYLVPPFFPPPFLPQKTPLLVFCGPRSFHSHSIIICRRPNRMLSPGIVFILSSSLPAYKWMSPEMALVVTTVVAPSCTPSQFLFNTVG